MLAAETGPEKDESAAGAPAAAIQGGASAAAKSRDRKTDPAPLTWYRPRFTGNRDSAHAKMIRYQMRDVRSGPVLDAMREVPRHEFVPEGLQRSAYADRPLAIGHGQTISQPYIVAYMTEALRIRPGDKVLEIGTGSGYQAAVLSELTPHVYSMEIIEPLADLAAKRLAKLGYKTIKTRHADGYNGWKEHAPFDAIIVTCAATHVPPPLIEQLKDGGRMCIPVGGRFSFQNMVLVEKVDGRVKSKSLMSVVFVPLTRSKNE